MGLVSVKEIAKALKLDKFSKIGEAISWVLMKVLRISAINRIYDKNKHLQGLDFLNSILDEFGVQFEISEEDLKKIPKEGAFITISNHPLGGIDGILLLKTLLEARPDYKIMANFLLHRIEPLKPYIFPVNPFENHKDKQSSLSGFKSAMGHLKEGFPLGIFPAGEVSTKKVERIYQDKEWEKTALKLIKNAKVPIIPIYFHAKNSPLFYYLAKFSSVLRTAKLPSELLTQRKRKIQIRIGRPILPKTQEEFASAEELGDFLRKKTYFLAKAYEKKKDFKPFSKLILQKNTPPEAIIPPVETHLLEKEVEFLRNNRCLLIQKAENEVFLAKHEHIPNILREIGRLREETFRKVGEGTNRSIDLDDYDHLYRHLFLWDNKEKKIAGAYRMGLASDFFDIYGIDGFYTHTLFRYEKELNKMLSETIEMGRAFVTPEYQQKPMPLFILWKGIAQTTLRFPEHKYLLGGVSISNQFSNFSKQLMINFMKSHYYDPYVAQYINPIREFRVKLKDADKEFVFEEAQDDLNKLDKIIDELEPGELRLPVLIKKYIKQNARVISFNVDPLFNDAVDALMYIKISDLPDSTIKPAIEEYEAQLEAEAKLLAQNKENQK